MNIILFTLVFICLDVVLRFVTRKTIRFSGLDVLFTASWLAGINYGIAQGIIVSLTLLVVHAFLRPSKSQYILFSFPAQTAAVILGGLLGPGRFVLSLSIYHLINTGLMIITGGFGVRFVLFLVINILFNLILKKVLFGF